MKGPVVFLMAFMLGQCLMAQQFSEGEGYSPERNYQPIEWLGVLRDSLVLLRGTIEEDGLPRNLQFEFFDDETLKRGRKLNLPDVFASRKDFFPEAIYIVGQEITIWGSSFDKNDRSNSLKVLRINPDSLPIQKSDKYKAQTEEMLSWPAAYFTNNSRRFEWAQSPSGAYLCAMSVESLSAKNQLRIRFQVWDSFLNEHAKYDARIPAELERFSVKKLGLDDNGKPFLLLEWSSNPRSQAFYAGYSFNRKDQPPVMFDFDFPGKQEGDIHWVKGNDEHLYFVGLYGKQVGEAPLEAEGLFLTQIQPGQAEVKSTSRVSFYEIKDSLAYLKTGKETYDELFGSMRIVQFSKAETGFYLWMEQQRQEEICQTDFRSNMMVCNTHYFNHNLVFLELSKSARVVQGNVLEKHQTLVEGDEVFTSMEVIGEGQEAIFNRGLGEQGRLTDPSRSKLAVWNGLSAKLVEFENAEPLLRAADGVRYKGNTFFLTEGRSQARVIRLQ